MEEKKHPVFEEESDMDKCCESPIANGATGSGYDNTIETCDKVRFKIIYYYAKSSDTVHVVDIWDTRMSPKNLQRRL